MDLKVTTLDGKAAGDVTLSDEIFGLDPRSDILQRCVTWQLAKRQRGTHDVKNRSEINRTGKKLYRQKGTGSARHGPAKVNLFRGGGRSFGPTPRSHAIDLPKKVRALALKHALSAKAKDGGIIVVDFIDMDTEEHRNAVLNEFRKVLANYPRSDKAPAALYKEALSLLELKDPTTAQARLQYLVDNFPQAEETPLARERLTALKER